MVSFKSLPAHLRRDYVAKEGAPPQPSAVSPLEQHYREDAATRHFFETYTLPDGRHLRVDTQEELIRNATMLQAIELTAQETTMTRASRGGSKTANWANITRNAADLKHKRVGEDYPYRHTLPSHERRLREALNKFRRQGCASLIPVAKYNNKHASKVVSEEQHYLLQEMLGNGRNLENKTIADIYNAAAARLGWQRLSPSAIGVWRKKLKRVTEAGRRGVKTYNNTFAMQAKRSRPTAPLYMWSADGWTAELLYKDVKVNKKGHKVTTYLNRLTLEIIMDAYNNYPVGYAIGDSENAEMIEQAMRDAMNHTKELFGQRYRTWQIQSDNFQKKRLTASWQSLGDKWIPAQVGNAKAKPIEQWFKHEMQKRCQVSEYPNWAGYGITADKDKQVNDDWLNANKNQFPTKAECVKQLEGIIENIRAEYREDFVNAFVSLPEADKLPMSEELYLFKFGLKTEPNRLEGQGLTPRIGGVEHFFDCFDLDFRNHYAERWVIYYDPADTRRALAVAQGKEELRFMVEEKYIQPMALRDRREGDARELRRLQDYNAADREYVTEERAKGIEVVQNLFARNKELNGGLASRLLITDSQGQHKKHLFKDAEEAAYEEQESPKEADYLKSKIDFDEYI
jgi:hypothetical protein